MDVIAAVLLRILKYIYNHKIHAFRHNLIKIAHVGLIYLHKKWVISDVTEFAFNKNWQL